MQCHGALNWHPVCFENEKKKPKKKKQNRNNNHFQVQKDTSVSIYSFFGFEPLWYFNFCSVCGNENKDYTGTLLRDQKKSHNQKIQRHTALQK